MPSNDYLRCRKERFNNSKKLGSFRNQLLSFVYRFCLTLYTYSECICID